MEVDLSRREKGAAWQGHLYQARRSLTLCVCGVGGLAHSRGKARPTVWTYFPAWL